MSSCRLRLVELMVLLRIDITTRFFFFLELLKAVKLRRGHNFQLVPHGVKFHLNMYIVKRGVCRHLNNGANKSDKGLGFSRIVSNVSLQSIVVQWVWPKHGLAVPTLVNCAHLNVPLRCSTQQTVVAQSSLNSLQLVYHHRRCRYLQQNLRSYSEQRSP